MNLGENKELHKNRQASFIQEKFKNNIMNNLKIKKNKENAQFSDQDKNCTNHLINKSKYKTVPIIAPRIATIVPLILEVDINRILTIINKDNLSIPKLIINYHQNTKVLSITEISLTISKQKNLSRTPPRERKEGYLMIIYEESIFNDALFSN